MDVQLPDGTILRGVPDGTTKAQIVDKLKANGRAVPADWLDAAPAAAEAKPDTAQAIGRGIMEIPRQVGLTARAGIKGAMALPGMVVDAGTGLVNAGADLIAGKGNGPRIPTSASALDNALTKIGLPEPRNSTERVVQDGASMMAGAGGMAKAAEFAGRGATGIARNVLQQMAARPGVQAAGAAAAGASGGSVREAGGGPLAQFAASLGGGIAGGLAADKLIGASNAAGNVLRSLATPKTEQIRAADQQISLILERAGIDWSQVPERVRQGLRTEVAQALNTGQPLNPDAVRRLAVFRQTGATPTVGQLTQDPGQITREMNLAKTGANSTDPGLQRLPALQNQNTARLLQQLDDAGAANAPTGANAARQVIGEYEGQLASAQQNVDRLYGLARDSSGRSVALDGATAMRNANQNLQRDLVGKLGGEVDDIMNKIASGETPLTVEYQQQLSKMLFRKMRAAGDNGDLRHGLGLVRQAIDNAEPIGAGAPQAAGAPLGQARPQLTGPAGAAPLGEGEQAIQAFRTARTANRELMTRIENNPALRAVYEGVEPDQFAQRFLIGKAASVRDVQALRGELSQEGADAVRSYLAGYLRDKATGGDRDIVKFGGKSYRDAFRDIEEKLGVFFSPEEVAQLRAIGETAKYMQAQPAGAAVNNSNSGALVLGRGLDLLDKIANYVPLGGRDIIKGSIQGAQQTQVLRPQNALVQLAAPQPKALRVNPLLAASIVSPAQAGEDNRRK